MEIGGLYYRDGNIFKKYPESEEIGDTSCTGCYFSKYEYNNCDSAPCTNGESGIFKLESKGKFKKKKLIFKK